MHSKQFRENILRYLIHEEERVQLENEYNFLCDPDGTYGELVTVYDRNLATVINWLDFVFLWLLR